jgi:hypothetical protein
MISKGSRGDVILIGISILGILILSYLLYDDSFFFQSEVRNKVKIVGKVSTKNSDVRRKYMDNFAWLPIENLADVFLGDSIFTGVNSNALISLNNGSSISLDPQSLIVLSMNQDNLTLDLQFGGLNAELLSEKSNINLIIGNEEVLLKGDSKPSTISFKKAKADSFPELRVKKGKLKIQQGKDKKITEVKESFKVLMNPALARLNVKSIVGFKEEGSLNSVAWVLPNEPVSLKWQFDGDITSFEVEVATDSDFNKVLIAKATEKEFIEWVPEQNIKKIFWRVKAFHPKVKLVTTSETRELSINHLITPSVRMPEDGQVFLILRDTDDKLKSAPSVPISIEDNLENSHYKLELSHDDKFTVIERSIESSTKIFEIKDIPPGIFYLRIKSQGPGRPDTSWSKTVKFNMNNQESVRILAPILVKSEIETILKQVKGKFPWPIIEWEPVKKAEKYVVEVSKENSFKTSIFLTTLVKTKIEISGLKEGKYYFRVRGSSQAVFGAWSDTGTIYISQTPPVIEPIANIIYNAKDWSSAIVPQKITFKWQPVARAVAYHLEVANTLNFKKIFLDKTTDNPFFTLAVDTEQTYYVRVTPLDNEARSVTVTSAVRKFDFIIKRALKPPLLKLPKNNMSYILYKMDVPHIWVEWEADVKATSHILEFSKNSDFTKIQKTVEVKKINMILDKNLFKGKIFWRARSLNSKFGLKSAWSETYIFYVVGLESEDN